MIPTRPNSTSRWAMGGTLVLTSFLATVLALTLVAGVARAATFNVTNTNDSGPGSLRQAITNANGNSNPATTDVINFNIQSGCAAGGGVCTISPDTELPEITQSVNVNGYSQTGASPNTLSTGNDATLKIELSGADAGASTNGLRITGSNSLVKGLIVNRWADAVVLGTGASGNTIEGNYIGTDASGQVGPGNEFGGVLLSDAPNNVVGGTSAAARNIISKNGYGVFLFGSPATGNRIEGNYIGTNASGTQELGNSGDGVLIFQAPDNVVGGTAPSTGNVIAHNGSDGVEVGGSDTPGNRILANSIFGNDGLGINLEGDAIEPNGVTPNDPQDTDLGPNNLQNYPSVTSADATVAGQAIIEGTLNSGPDRPFAIRFYSSPTADTSGFGEGKTYLGETTISTDAGGDGTFNFTTNKPIVGQVVTATATDRFTKDTSEFSEAEEVGADTTRPTVVSTNPRNAATGVAPAVKVTASFSEQMKASTINSTTFKLFRKAGTTNTKVAAVVTYNASRNRATLNPNVNLIPRGRYVAQVTTGVQDLAGNGLARRKDFAFTVRPQ